MAAMFNAEDKITGGLPADGENVSHDQTASQQELLITEIESADGHLVNVLR